MHASNHIYHHAAQELNGYVTYDDSGTPSGGIGHTRLVRSQ